MKIFSKHLQLKGSAIQIAEKNYLYKLCFFALLTLLLFWASNLKAQSHNNGQRPNVYPWELKNLANLSKYKSVIKYFNKYIPEPMTDAIPGRWTTEMKKIENSTSKVNKVKK